MNCKALLFFVLLLTVTLSTANRAMAERRVALVIGNSQYQAVPKLANPRNDARDITSALRNFGFYVITKTDLTRDQLISTLLDFAREVDRADWAVVYYSGHGIEVNGLNYMVPVDARLTTDRDVNFEAVPMNLVLTAVDNATKLKLVILDACRDNPFAHQIKRTMGARSIGRGLGQVEPDAGVLVAYAAKHGQVALDGDGSNSPFVTSLLARMNTPNLEVRRMFDLVRDDVLQSTRRQQQPFTYGSLPGSEDYYFVRTAAVIATPAPTPLPVPVPVPPEPQLDPKELARSLQAELGRVGCEPGPPDGVWGPASQRALQTYNRTLNKQLETNIPTSSALNDLRNQKGRGCPISTFEMLGQWNLTYTDSNGCRYSGTLSVEQKLSNGTYSGYQRHVMCDQSTITQTATITLNGNQVTINFSDPRGSTSYNADNYYLSRVSDTVLRGSNRDVAGNGQAVQLTKTR